MTITALDCKTVRQRINQVNDLDDGRIDYFISKSSQTLISLGIKMRIVHQRSCSTKSLHNDYSPNMNLQYYLRWKMLLSFSTVVAVILESTTSNHASTNAQQQQQFFRGCLLVHSGKRVQLDPLGR